MSDNGNEPSRNDIKLLLEKNDLDVKYWRDILSGYGITKPTQLRFLETSQWEDICAKKRFSWEGNALKSFLRMSNIAGKEMGSEVDTVHVYNLTEQNDRDPTDRSFVHVEWVNDPLDDSCVIYKDTTLVHNSVSSANSYKTDIEQHDELQISSVNSDYLNTENEDKDMFGIEPEHLKLTTIEDTQTQSDTPGHKNTEHADTNVDTGIPGCEPEHLNPSTHEDTQTQSDTPDHKITKHADTNVDKEFVDHGTPSKYFKKILTKLHLDEYYPSKLTETPFLVISAIYDKCNLGMAIIKQLLMRNRNGRDNILHEINRAETNQAKSKKVRGLSSKKDAREASDKFSSADVMYVIYQCCDPLLKQTLWEKLDICKLAFPILLPSPSGGMPTITSWPLRSLQAKCNKKNVLMSLPKANMPIITFLRLGKCNLSKSLIMNSIIDIDETFFNKQSKTGDVPSSLCSGMVECCVYQASGRTTDPFRQSMLLCNLRGDGNKCSNEINVLVNISDILIVFVQSQFLFQKETIDNIKVLFNCHDNILVVDNSETHLNEDDFKEFNRLVGEDIEDNICPIMRGTRNEQSVSKEINDEITNIYLERVKKHQCSLEEKLSHDEDSLTCAIIDEDDKQCKQQHDCVTKIFKQIISNRTHGCNRALLPLQGLQWKTYSEYMKKAKGTQSMTMDDAVKYNEKVQKCKAEMALIQPSEMTLQFALHLTKISNCPRSLHYFVKWLKQYLNDGSLQNMTYLRDQWLEAQKELKSKKKKVPTATLR